MKPITVIFALMVFLAYVVIRKNSNHGRLYLADAFVWSLFFMFAGSVIVWFRFGTEGAGFTLYASSLALVSATLFQIPLVLLLPSYAPRSLPYSPVRKRAPYQLTLALIVVLNLGVILLLLSNPAIRSLLFSEVTGGGSSVLAVRKAITASTEGYMAPGLIKQIRDILGPMLLAAYVLSAPQWRRRAIFWVAPIVLAAGIYLSGQRMPLMILFFVLALSSLVQVSIQQRHIRLDLRKAVLPATAGLAAFTMLTLALGRVGPGEGFLSALGGALPGIFERIVIRPVAEGVYTYPYWSSLGPTGGQSWLDGLSILLPGASGHTIYNQIHMLIGGSAQGNVSLIFPIESWLAFGWPGVVVAPVIFLMVINSLDRMLWLNRGPYTDAARYMFFGYLFVVHAPFGFLLYGGIVVLFVCAVIVCTRRRPLAEANRRPGPAFRGTGRLPVQWRSR